MVTLEKIFILTDFDLMCDLSLKVSVLNISNKKRIENGGAANQSWINILKGNIEIIKSLNKMNRNRHKILFFKFLNRISQYFSFSCLKKRFWLQELMVF